ncbi:hypothetical protein FSOLCH5_011396 [Fusarium solani]
MSETSYSALSYVWGDVSDTVEISVNGSSLKIGRNLHAGLEQLRENGIHDWLWIDSICIQQSDLDEKSYQVGLMRAIFSNADRVYSWLGPGSNGSDAAMDFISHIGPTAMKFEGLDLLPRDERVIAYLNNPSSYKDSAGTDGNVLGYARLLHDILHEPDLRGKDHGDEGLATGIQGLMERDYWHRIWITQEVALAKEVVIVTDDSLGILRRHGCQVDIVTEVMQPHKETGGRDRAAIDLANSVSRLKSICDFMNLGTEIGPGEDYIWRVLLAPHWYRRINASMRKDIATLVRQIMRRSPIDTDKLTSEQTNFIHDLRDFWNKPPEIDDVSAQLANARKRLQEHERLFNYHRTLFKTPKTMLGLGYKMVRPGDLVTLLWGVKSPIILRPREGGGFTYVGDAYIDGIMHGEFLKTQPVDEEFEIY